MTRQLHDNAAPAPQPCSAAGQTVDAFDDIRVLRYNVPGFDQLPLPQKQLIYYLSEAALCGRDILYDQNCRYNLVVRRTLEAVYRAGTADPQAAEWLGFEKYLKKVWFANGIHHHYAGDKFVPEFSEAWFDARLAALPDEALPLDFGSRAQVTAIVRRVLFDPAFCAVRECRTAGEDLLTGSAMNYYDGVTQAEAEGRRQGKHPAHAREHLRHLRGQAIPLARGPHDGNHIHHGAGSRLQRQDPLPEAE